MCCFFHLVHILLHKSRPASLSQEEIECTFEVASLNELLGFYIYGAIERGKKKLETIKMGRIGYFGILIIGVLAFMGSTEAHLKMGFYNKRCPKAEKIVNDFVKQHIHNAPSLAATLLRMHFHDCFVRGCDASVLLNTTSGEQPERQATPNLTLRGFDFIDRVKSLVEAECPGIVSCADILTLVARDSIVATGGPFWRVPTGRRDGLISKSSEALSKIPSPSDNFTTLQTLFANHGLDLKDLVILSGAHTIGIAHCQSFLEPAVQFHWDWRSGSSSR
ncbi:PEROXIDASE 25-RELATED [Salix koriyanagi]|uniref:peroxidase n=1 Tax=Salix koriyanagi TaxID=2511006 RepID=A0A9Q0SVA7_9ROSI|nr:PEROXIDASE 25-RELATED [Salix koriyanagi]